MISAVLQKEEFQKCMTTTERNYLLGKYYAAQEKCFGVKPGLLATCYKHDIPVFVGAPADGSIFLESVKLKKLSELTGKSYKHDIDLHADVFEACAYHYWGLFNSEKKSLAILILGGGTSKNYSLQPEPSLSQAFLLEDIRGFDYDVQIVTAPVTDGSLSSCLPDEGVTWGKINQKTYRQKTVSVPADYSMVMPLMAKGLLANPKLKRRSQLRLFGQRKKLIRELEKKIQEREREGIYKKTLRYPLAFDKLQK